MVHRPAFPPQQRGEAPVAVVTVTDSQALEHIPQLYLFPFGSDAPPVPVVTRAADARQRAHPLDGQAALRGRHRVDEREDAVAPRVQQLRPQPQFVGYRANLLARQDPANGSLLERSAEDPESSSGHRPSPGGLSLISLSHSRGAPQDFLQSSSAEAPEELGE